MVCKNLLRSRMAEKGLTQKSLAEMVGISKNTLSAKLNNKTPFNTIEINKICLILNIEDNTEKVNIFLGSSSQFRDENNGGR